MKQLDFDTVTPEDIIDALVLDRDWTERDEKEQLQWHIHVEILGEDMGCMGDFPGDTEDQAIDRAIDGFMDEYLFEHPEADESDFADEEDVVRYCTREECVDCDLGIHKIKVNCNPGLYARFMLGSLEGEV